MCQRDYWSHSIHFHSQHDLNTVIYFIYYYVEVGLMVFNISGFIALRVKTKTIYYVVRNLETLEN